MEQESPKEPISTSENRETNKMHEFWKAYPLILEDLKRVRSVIAWQLKGQGGGFDQALGDLRESKGKMLRPGFLLLSARTKYVEGEAPAGAQLDEKLYNIAAAIELLHMATLVHDDILDEAELRRGNPAVHVEHGRRKAVLLGDFLFSRCFSLVADYASVENARDIARGVAAICRSEMKEKQPEDATSIREYLHRIIGKTAVLFAMSFYVGAVENGIAQEQSSLLRRIGYNIGMGFQVKDDILDLEGSGERLGKPVGSDIREGLKTLPVIYALKTANGSLSAYLKKSSYTKDDITTIVRMVRDAGGIRKAEEYAHSYTHRALKEIEHLPESRNSHALRKITEELLYRDY